MGKIIQEMKMPAFSETPSGHRYTDSPKEVTIDNCNYKVERIISHLHKLEKDIFNLRLVNGKECRVSYMPTTKTWAIEKNYDWCLTF